MKLLDFAMDMEKNGIAYYEELKEKTSNPKLNHIFDILIKNEYEHYEICKSFKESSHFISNSNSTVLEEASDIFEQIKSEGLRNDYSEIASLLKHAISIEERSENFYKDFVQEESDEQVKEAFSIIAGEENKHRFILKRLYDYMSGDPDAELSSGEYVGWVF